MDTIVTKKCPKCKKDKTLSEFYKDKHKKDGFYVYCKKCHKENCRDWEKRNPDKTRLHAKASMQKQREKNPEKFKRIDRNSYAKFLEKIKKRVKEYRKKNPEKYLEYNRKRRARKKGAVGSVTSLEWTSVLEKYNHSCLCCGKKEVKITMDHIVPLICGGRHVIENIQPLCSSCNSRKGARTIDYR